MDHQYVNQTLIEGLSVHKSNDDRELSIGQQIARPVAKVHYSGDKGEESIILTRPAAKFH